MRRRLHIRTKLAAALAIPVLTLVGVAGYEVAQAHTDAEAANSQANIATAISGPGTLLQALQDERNVVALDVLGLPPSMAGMSQEDVADAASDTEAAHEEFVNFLGEQSSEIEAIYAPALERYEDDERGVHTIREEVDAYEDGQGFEASEYAAELFYSYSDIVDVFITANSRLAGAIDDSELRSGANLVDVANRQEDIYARIVGEVVFSTFAEDSSGSIEDGDVERITNLAALRDEMHSNEQLIVMSGEGQYAPLVEDYLGADFIQNFGEIVDRVIDDGIAVPLISDGDSGDSLLDNANVATEDLPPGQHNHNSFQTAVRELLTAEASSLQDEARQTWLFYIALSVVGLGIAAGVTLLVSRSITRPLRSLTEQASSMANERLPHAVQDILETPLGEDVTVPHVDPIEVRTRDEVADVAHALNTVQDSALELAVEQAVLRRNIADSFVNLGRRNQNLLGRQLDFITELEQNETDPDTLANLFRLDHLATRMRRNAESLLVLAGIDPPRKWAAPVRLTDVIRAALGEVEDYQRVTVRAVEPATVIGSTAADLAHLLAELIENALTFSPPDQTVEVRGRNQPGGYTLAIVDSGLGMPPEEITRANRRLAGAESFTIAPSKYLGHYVAGNLAARHNITIQLQDAAAQGDRSVGSTATVYLPPTLLTVAEQEEDSTPEAFVLADHAPGAPALRTGDTQEVEAVPDMGPGGPEAPAPTSTSWQVPQQQAPVTAEQPAIDPAAQPGGSEPSFGVTAGGLAKRSPGRGTIPTAGDRGAASALPPGLAPPPASSRQGQGQQPQLPQPGPPPQPEQPDGPPTEPVAPVGPVDPVVPAVGSLPRRPTAHNAPQAPLTPPPGTPVTHDLSARGSTEPAAVSEELLRTLATYTDKLQRNVSPNRPTTPPRGNPIPDFPSSPPAPAPGVPQVGAAAPATGETPAPAPGQHTSSGLARRVRGAQMPTTEPLNLTRHRAEEGAAQPVRQGSGEESSASGPQARHRGDRRLTDGLSSYAAGISSGQPTGGEPNGDDPASSQPARDVYNFLSSFTSGVQRGLDEAHHSPTPEEDL